MNWSTELEAFFHNLAELARMDSGENKKRRIVVSGPEGYNKAAKQMLDQCGGNESCNRIADNSDRVHTCALELSYAPLHCVSQSGCLEMYAHPCVLEGHS